MRVICDWDYAIYGCGFAVERSRFDVSVVRPDGTEAGTICETRDEVAAWLSDEPEGTVSQVDVLVEAEPLSHATFLMDRTLTAIDQSLTEKGLEFDRMELYITGKGNFREQLSTIRGYKANRDPTHRPVHYKSLRRYVKNKYGATEVTGWEADDEIAAIAHAEQYDPDRLVIVGIDKDLDTIPGLHYNHRLRSLYRLAPEEALANFYRQLITGDAVDNIGGVYRAGPKAAEQIAAWMSEADMYDLVLHLYRDSLRKKGCPYVNMTAEDALLENARLLHLRRWPGQLWVPPGEGSSSGPSSSASSGTDSTTRESSTSTKPVPLTSPSRFLDVVGVAGTKVSLETLSILPTSSSVAGPSRPRESSRPKTGSGS